MKRRKSLGFTLIELIVVVVILGVLGAIALPQYLKSMEMSKADDALSTVQMIATTNRMYGLDHPAGAGQYVNGQQSSSCGGQTCQGNGAACDLVACGYLANQDFDNKPYNYYACPNGAGSGPCCGANIVACAQRKSGPAPGTTNSNYQNWGYAVNNTGQVNCLPVSCGSTGAPPTPSS